MRVSERERERESESERVRVSLKVNDEPLTKGGKGREWWLMDLDLLCGMVVLRRHARIFYPLPPDEPSLTLE